MRAAKRRLPGLAEALSFIQCFLESCCELGSDVARNDTALPSQVELTAFGGINNDNARIEIST